MPHTSLPVVAEPVEVLSDVFGRVHNYLRISITDHCNLRCTYCMPETQEFAPASHLMSASEIYTIAKVFVDMGVKKIRLTGGEPLIRKDAGDILARLGELPVELTITTNATRVHEFIPDFKTAGIHSVNVSLDTFNREKFQQITRRDQFERVMQNIGLLIKEKLNVKLNVVAMKGVNEEEIADFVEFTRHHPVEVRFIEFMPFSGNQWERDKVLDFAYMLEQLQLQFQVEKLNNEKHATSVRFHVPGYAGSFAFINTVTAPFCGDCNRLRLTADGKMKNCLFSADEMDLLGALRNGEDITNRIRQSLYRKKERTGGQDFSLPMVNRSMVAIGG